MKKNDKSDKREKKKEFGDSSDEDSAELEQQPNMDVFDDKTFVEPPRKRPKKDTPFHTFSPAPEPQRQNPFASQMIGSNPSLFSTSSPFSHNFLPPPRNPNDFYPVETPIHPHIAPPRQPFMNYPPAYPGGMIPQSTNIPTSSGVWFRNPVRPSNTTFSSSMSSYTTGNFVLLEQPNGRQKRNDSKLMQPDPFIVCLSDSAEDERNRIISGHVSVTLVNKDGSQLDEGPVLSSPYGLHQNLNEGLIAKFSLKISGPSFGSSLALKFHVFYFTDTTSRQESILSRPFIIYSDRRRQKGTVEVTGIKPERGLLNQTTEVWIKGNTFSDMVGVTFGGIPAAIKENSPNFLVVIAPARPDLPDGTVVKVIVTNSDPDSPSSSQPKDFTYKAVIPTYGPKPVDRTLSSSNSERNTSYEPSII